MKKLGIIAAIVIFIIIILFILIKNQGYDIKVKLSVDNLSANEIDNEIANELKDRLLSIPEVSEVLIFSKINYCLIYCKIAKTDAFFINKNEIKEKIKSQIGIFSLNYNKDISIEVDDRYETIYNKFFIIYSTIDRRIALKNYIDLLEDEILNLNITSNLSFLAPIEPAYYINYSTNELKKYDISINDIKNLIKENNLKINSAKFSSKSSLGDFKINSQIQNIHDIKKIPIYYKNNNFSTTFDNVFKIKENTLDPPNNLAFYKNYPAEIIGIKPKKIYPDFLFNLKLNKALNNFKNEVPDFIKIEPLKKFKITEIYLDKNSNIKAALAFYDKIKEFDNDAIFIIGSNFIKTNQNDIFEKNPNMITVLSKNDKIKKYLKKEGIIFKDNSTKMKERLFEDLSGFEPSKADFRTKKALKTDYYIDSIMANEYKLNKEEIANSIIASTEGLILDYCYNETNKIPIILKAKDDFIYSKNLKAIVTLSSVVTKDIKEDFETIVRKNSRFYSASFSD